MQIANMQLSAPEPSKPFRPSQESNVPLYAQTMAWLTEQIETQFEHNQRFYTERELIEKLGVSQPTVWRAMQELVNRGVIRRHVGRGSFVQKYTATRLIGIIMPHYHSAMLMEQINAIADLCGEFNCNLRIHHIRKGESPHDLARSLKANPHEERMVLLGLHREASKVLCEELGHRGFRSVCAAPHVPGDKGSCVSVDQKEGARIMLDYLTGLGHRRIAFLVNESTELVYIRARVDAISEQVASRGLTQCSFIHCNTALWADAFEAALGGMEQFASQTPRATAVVPVSGVGAWAALRFASIHGLRVPKDFSVFSYDDVPGAQMLHPALSGLQVDRTKQARTILQLLWGDDSKPRHVVVSPHLAVRESTAKLPSKAPA